MKSPYRNLLAGILLLTTFLLSGCFDVDADLFERIANAWAEDKGVIEQGEVQPAKLIREVNKALVADTINSGEIIQLDGLDVIRDIEKADELSDDALQTLDTAKMASALSIRPEDWTLHEKDAAVWMANGNPAAAASAYTKSDELLLESVQHGGDCTRLRQEQLLKRADSLQEAGMACQSDPSCRETELIVIREEMGRYYELIHEAEQTGIADICPD